MKYVKMLALAAVAAGALMAFNGAGTASASKLCSTTSDPCPAGQSWPVNTVLDFSIPSGSQFRLRDTDGGELDSCSTSTIKGKITNAGSSTETVTGPFEELTWGSCTTATKTLKLSRIEIHKIAGASNGTVTADGTFEWTIWFIVASCVYGVTAGTHLGEITEGKAVAAPTFEANAVAEEFSGSGLCPNTAKWTGTYTLTSPSGTTLSVTAS